MTAATAVADETLAAGLIEQPDQQVGQTPPAGAAEDQVEQRGEVESTPRAAGCRLQDVTILSLIAAVQLCWLTAVGYGVFSLVS
jgi:hypothetical protein